MNNPTKKINFVAFSELRPGTPYAETKEILLRHWRDVTNKDEGWIDLFKYDCSLRVDKEGIIGEVHYFGRFPPKRVIEGLNLGMEWEQVQKIYPDLKPHPKEEEEEMWYRHSLDSNTLMVLRKVNNVLSRISIITPNATYNNKDDNYIRDIYPAATLQDPPHFQCPNLKLVVLESLLYDGHIDLGEPDELASFVLGRFIDFNEEDSLLGYETIPECLEYLYHYPLTEEQLSKVTELLLDAASDIYSYICFYWDGESGEFDVTSFKGVENLPNLQRISSVAMTDLSDSELQYVDSLTQKDIEVEIE